jgi:hypothetical protein
MATDHDDKLGRHVLSSSMQHQGAPPRGSWNTFLDAGRRRKRPYLLATEATSTRVKPGDPSHINRPQHGRPRATARCRGHGTAPPPLLASTAGQEWKSSSAHRPTPLPPPPPPRPARKSFIIALICKMRQQAARNLFEGAASPLPATCSGQWSTSATTRNPIAPRIKAPRSRAPHHLLSRKPETGPRPQTLRLLTIQGNRPPLSLTLRPARPPEEREGGAGGRKSTLKATIERGREGGPSEAEREEYLVEGKISHDPTLHMIPCYHI